MRGKGPRLWARTARFRITPAHAGKRLGIFSFEGSYEDHPRTCGEKDWTDNIREKTGGSPPHMRGKAGANILGKSLD